ncbi:hypothetical protein [Streptomyces daliensis]|uniref:Uncharacterized protein n=1 Tax=Streptomyces daliensis TaxID=299421 RepID=A0A8T4IIA2_9ACTN|nr:hypothetical protein [Streptomyces daliensis]
MAAGGDENDRQTGDGEVGGPYSRADDPGNPMPEDDGTTDPDAEDR